MARISGVNIPTNKRVHVALTYIYGIGTKIAEDICAEASIDISKRVSQLLGFNYPYPKIMDTSKSVNQIGIGYKANK